jgi:putative transposase
VYESGVQSVDYRMLTTLRKKHSKSEIGAKLVQADDLARQGVRQHQIAQTLGVSVMTLYRWRKIAAQPHTTLLVPDNVVQFEVELGSDQRLVELELENFRLRRLVTDLLLEKVEIGEGAQGNSPRRHGRNRTLR